MINLYIKYSTLIICSICIFAKLLNFKSDSKRILFNLIFALLLSFSIYCIRIFSQCLTIPTLIISSLTYILLSEKIEIGLAITTTIISYGISLTIYLISSVFTSTVFSCIGIAYSESTGRIILIFSALIQLLLCCIPFKFRRLKSGMPFLRSKGGGNTGVIISTVLLCCFLVSSSADNPESVFFTIPVSFIFICGVLILLWWRSELKNAYLEKLRANEIRSLRETIQKNDEKIKYLEQHNDYLAKIIHKDNKLIPAMELAVREYLHSSELGNGADIQLKGKTLLEQLNAISCERSGIIKEYQFADEKLPLTGVFQIDALMTYMLSKARENGIKYEVTISSSVKYMVENIISASDLRTILADLIENAIIAAKDCDKKEILVSLGAFEGYYMIDIFDSGIPFEPETLIDFGRKKNTTHANSGGSGIGLMTVSEILNNYGASFIIEELSDEYTFFTKKVSVKFDNLNQYIIKADTNKDIRVTPVRENLIVNI